MKKIFVGIIIILMLLLPSISAIPYLKSKEYEEIINQNKGGGNDDLPDYIITKVGKGYDAGADGIYYYIVIKNIGDKKGGWGYTVYIDEYKANFFKPDEKYNDYVVGESGPYGLEPGDSRSLRFSWGFFDEHPWFPRYECTLECDFLEKNSDNNYFDKTYFNFMVFLIPLPFLF
jgi:hypothetical protein